MTTFDETLPPYWIATMPPKFIPVLWPAPDPKPIPPGSMRVAPGSDAVVWLTAPKHGGEL